MASLVCRRLGIRVPEDLSLISFLASLLRSFAVHYPGARGSLAHQLWREGAITRRLTSVTVDEEELGRRTVQLLHEMRVRERPLDAATEILMPLSLSDGETLGPKPKKP